MSDEEQQECEECVPGLPIWMGTFADLMSLLMCFFVLLLSFAEMDVLKFKRLAGSMRTAFGVQNQVELNAVPKGTSIIAKEFSPGRPKPTPLQVIMQHTVNTDKQTLAVFCQAEIETAVMKACADSKDVVEQKQEQISQLTVREQAQAESKAEEISEKLEKEISKGMVKVETKGREIIIRVQEKGVFASGSAELQSDFIPVLDKLIDILQPIDSDIVIEGHTDDVPIKTDLFPSNWDLSTARALKVAHGLFDDGYIKQNRFTIIGRSDTRPLVPNDTRENRARNRRVEIILKEKTEHDVKQESQEDSNVIDLTDDNEFNQIFDLAPEEIF